MSFRKSFAGFVAVVAPFVLFSINATQSHAQSEGDNATAIAPMFKTVSIKLSRSRIVGGDTTVGPDELTAPNAALQGLIRHAYDVQDDQIIGAPSWLNSERYDIEAKTENPVAGEDPGRLLESGLLSKYFKLAVHRETRLVPVYELVIAGDGPKLRESDSSQADSTLRVIQVESGRIAGREVPIATLARILSDQLGRPVLDGTKLSSHYDVTLQWPTALKSSEPPILTAIQEQLGLKLVPQLMPKEFLVIDHVEMPVAR
jgi:uncharacterized protein (TIGR03435 family)